MQKQKESRLKINASHAGNADTGKFLIIATLFVCLSVCLFNGRSVPTVDPNAQRQGLKPWVHK